MQAILTTSTHSAKEAVVQTSYPRSLSEAGEQEVRTANGDYSPESDGFCRGATWRHRRPVQTLPISLGLELATRLRTPKWAPVEFQPIDGTSPIMGKLQGNEV